MSLGSDEDLESEALLRRACAQPIGAREPRRSRFRGRIPVCNPSVRHARPPRFRYRARDGPCADLNGSGRDRLQIAAGACLSAFAPASRAGRGNTTWTSCSPSSRWRTSRVRRPSPPMRATTCSTSAARSRRRGPTAYRSRGAFQAGHRLRLDSWDVRRLPTMWRSVAVERLRRPLAASNRRTADRRGSTGWMPPRRQARLRATVTSSRRRRATPGPPSRGWATGRVAGFGRLATRYRPARAGRNPRSGACASTRSAVVAVAAERKRIDVVTIAHRALSRTRRHDAWPCRQRRRTLCADDRLARPGRRRPRSAPGARPASTGSSP